MRELQEKQGKDKPGGESRPDLHVDKEPSRMREVRKNAVAKSSCIKATNRLVRDREHNCKKQFCGSKRGLKSKGECVAANGLALRGSPQGK
jgi:hypothetical protein